MEEFRPNAAAILIRPDGRILIAERINPRGAWQFPQGGVDKGESPKQALRREVEEEVGISPDQYSIIDKKSGYRYSYPNGHLKKGRYAGQEQTYYLCELKKKDPPVDLFQKPREFRNACWIKPKQFDLRWLPKFKRATYRAVIYDFFKIEL